MKPAAAIRRACGPAATGRRTQRGLATLVVVMLLLFVVGMVAAYTSRTLLFEQRTGANQNRSTQGLEAAEAGLQWAIGMLNASKIDIASCTADATGTTFRDRYLSLNATTGAFTARTGPATGAALHPSCVFNGTTWTCNCPADGAPTLVPPVTTESMPAFRVRFINSARAGTVTIQVNGCTKYTESCLAFPAQGTDNEGRVTVTALLALRSAVGTAPQAPLTARGNVSAQLTLVNNLESSSGLTAHAGGVVNVLPPGALVSRPGTPGDLSKADGDQVFKDYESGPMPAADRMFIATFAMAPDVYAAQPAAIRLNCPGACGTAALQALADINPGRLFWLTGNVTIDGSLGSVAQPVLLVVDGDLVLAPGANVTGLIYVRRAIWNPSLSAGTLRGALVAEGEVSGTGSATLIYDDAVLAFLRRFHGSMVLVPGSWKDF